MEYFGITNDHNLISVIHEAKAGFDTNSKKELNKNSTHLQYLINMGFDSNHSVRALEISKHNLQAAIELLLTDGSF